MLQEYLLQTQHPHPASAATLQASAGAGMCILRRHLPPATARSPHAHACASSRLPQCSSTPPSAQASTLVCGSKACANALSAATQTCDAAMVRCVQHAAQQQGAPDGLDPALHALLAKQAALALGPMGAAESELWELHFPRLTRSHLPAHGVHDAAPVCGMRAQRYGTGTGTIAGLLQHISSSPLLRLRCWPLRRPLHVWHASGVRLLARGLAACYARPAYVTTQMEAACRTVPRCG